MGVLTCDGLYTQKRLRKPVAEMIKAGEDYSWPAYHIGG